VIKNMGEESLYGKVEMFIVENIGKMKEADKGPCLGQMEVNTKAIGLKEFNMVTEKLLLLMGPSKKEFSRIICLGVLIMVKLMFHILKMTISNLQLLKMKQHSMQVNLVVEFTLAMWSQLVLNQRSQRKKIVHFSMKLLGTKLCFSQVILILLNQSKIIHFK
jgi:hypothetical protein